eukprot:TRINITY_DN2648_c0_g1_i2.p1 TRINITY_DN2648_c0_g1~~TRINITY_DN2648_c0_g1_i2.p1  ORF type:complete len:391 (+),score=169.81 TRINITY_DN2648_c0_g1_i2:118-1173(+)
MKREPPRGRSGSGYNSPGYEEKDMLPTPPKPAPVPSWDKPKEVAAPVAKAPLSKGMALGKAKKTDLFFESLKQEEQLVAASMPAAAAAAASGRQAVEEPRAPSNGLKVGVEELVNISLERDGGVRKFEVRGEVKLTIVDPDVARVCLVCEPPAKNSGIQYRPHPKIDAKAWTSEGLLVLKDRSKPFPVGTENSCAILKWRLANTDEELVPLTVNFWPSSENGRSVVSVEYTMRDAFLDREEPFVLNNVIFSIPCPTREMPDVTQYEGEFQFDARNGRLMWKVEEITPGQSGSLEFSIPEIDSERFFPIDINFVSSSTYSALQIHTARHAESEEEIAFDSDIRCGVEKFVIE